MHGKIRERRAKVIRRGKRFRLYSVIGVLGISGVASLGYGVSRTPFFKVRKLMILGATPAIQSSIDSELASVMGKNLFSLDSKVLATTLKRSPLFSNVLVRKSLPSEVVVKVSVRSPVALVRTAPSSFAEISRGGILFQQVSVNSVPPLPEICVVSAKGFGNCSSYVDPLSVGERLPKQVMGAVLIAQKMTPQELASYKYVGVSPSGELYLSDGGGFVCKLGGSTSVKAKLKLCDAMKQAFGSQGGPSYVDVSAPANPTVEPTSWLS